MNDGLHSTLIGQLVNSQVRSGIRWEGKGEGIGGDEGKRERGEMKDGHLVIWFSSA